MSKKIVTNGVCTKCKEVVPQKGAQSHIAKCLNRDREDTPDGFLVKVQWPHKNPIYWLYLSVPCRSTLGNLDGFLRKIWLECCEHMSQFTINDTRYSSHFEESPYRAPNDASMSIRSDKVLVPGLKFIHEYDFGSTTELLLEVVGFIKSVASKEIRVIIQNQEPEFECSSCDKRAELICMSEGDYLCKSCTEYDEDDEESYLSPLVNSPRTGVCGYNGL